MEAACWLDRRTIYRGRVIEVEVDRVRLPNGTETELEMVRHPGAAAIVPFENKEDILLVRQFRWATGGWIYEIPAGKLEGESDPALCAARELREEVGRKAGRLEFLGTIWTTPGFTDEAIHLFMATELEPVAQALEEDEVLQVVRLPFLEALDKVRRGEIPDAKTQCALAQVVLRRQHACRGAS